MNIKELVKKIPLIKPSFNFFYKIIIRPFNIINIGLYTTFRTLIYTGSTKEIQGWKASMRVSCHIIEKGLTMPDKRLGFGQERIHIILNEILNHEEYKDVQEIKIAVGLIKEYDIFHKINEYTLPVDLQKLINKVIELFPNISPLTQIKLKGDEVFSSNDAVFPIFAASRHSIRNFSGEVSLEQINNSIELALTSPSACNRQAVKCHLFCDKGKVQELLSYQNGNRGFGHLVSQLCILSVDVRMIGTNEQNDIYTNAGMFAMNLSYAFHYYKVASCILNWSVGPRKNKILRKIANIPKEENIVMIIALGRPGKDLEIARSQRKKIKDAVIYH
jgi:nitroreductase